MSVFVAVKYGNWLYTCIRARAKDAIYTTSAEKQWKSYAAAARTSYLRRDKNEARSYNKVLYKYELLWPPGGVTFNCESCKNRISKVARWSSNLIINKTRVW